jgi:serine/threonine-protein phosphatase 2B catalytic subunit
MLIAILNCCTKEELEEEDDSERTPYAAWGGVTDMFIVEDTSVERRAAIKKKILAVGRMSRVFALLR